MITDLKENVNDQSSLHVIVIEFLTVVNSIFGLYNDIFIIQAVFISK